MDAGANPRVRLIGLPTDSHSSFLRGPAQAPAAIRAALASDHMNLAAESGEDIVLDDAGDLPLDETATDVDSSSIPRYIRVGVLRSSAR